jgi:hypothetical protein
MLGGTGSVLTVDAPEPAIAADRFRADVDAVLDHDPTPRG